MASVPFLPTTGHAPRGVQPKQTPADGVARLFTEEAHIPVFTADESGRFDPSLEVPNVPQPLMNVRRLPV